MTSERKPDQRWFSKSVMCFSAVLLCLACGTTESEKTLSGLPADQAILFEVSYVNFAWGHQCSGWYVNAAGQRYSYSYADGEDPWQPENPEAITEQELLDKFSHGARLLGTVDSSEVAASKDLILASAVGSMSDTVSMCADFGTGRYLAYVRDDSTLTYRPVLLYQHGDWAARNLSTDARTLFSWLRVISDDHDVLECGPPD
jgi:hypothetical protein